VIYWQNGASHFRWKIRRPLEIAGILRAVRSGKHGNTGVSVYLSLAVLSFAKLRNDFREPQDGYSYFTSILLVLDIMVSISILGSCQARHDIVLLFCAANRINLPLVRTFQTGHRGYLVHLPLAQLVAVIFG